MTSPLHSLLTRRTQEAVISRLSNDATLAALIEGVYDYVPPAVGAVPYLSFGDITAETRPAHPARLAELDFSLHGWSAYPGSKELLEIAAQVQALLTKAGLTITDARPVWLRLERQELKRLQDGQTRMLMMVYRMLVEYTGA